MPRRRYASKRFTRMADQMREASGIVDLVNAKAGDEFDCFADGLSADGKIKLVFRRRETIETSARCCICGRTEVRSHAEGEADSNPFDEPYVCLFHHADPLTERLISACSWRDFKAVHRLGAVVAALKDAIDDRRHR
ncbi:MAG: hypothetical protein P4L82_12130 [Ancalomicrobiaceae bacterium]|nr:hypothetical protein [Ancalomicrobiaceae bacterium]